MSLPDVSPHRASQTFRSRARIAIGLLLVAAALTVPASRHSVGNAGEAGEKSVATGVPSAQANTTAAEVQRLRNLGKAYYEQGKYDDAVAQFEKVAGSGKTFPIDHFNLGLALLQDNQLDQALGEFTTTSQMEPQLLATHYNLGVLYKRELRYPDAEAEFRHVTGADPTDPAAWFNLGTVCFAEKKLPEALDAFERVTEMGFGRGQNFYVAATFHVFTILTRLKRPDEAQKYLKINQSLRDKVPNISIQYPALEAGRYGAIIVPPAAPESAASDSNVASITLTDLTAALGIHSNGTGSKALVSGEVKASEYSLDFARRTYLSAFPPSFAIGDYDSDGHPDLYIVDPGGHNRLLHNSGKGGFIDVTEKAGVAGDGRGVSAVFADYDNSGHPSLLVAGLGGVTVYHNHGDGTFTNETGKAHIAGTSGELDTSVIALDSDNDGFLDVVVTAYTDLSVAPHKVSLRFPQDFEGTTSHLYRNNGDGTFVDVTTSAGLGAARGKMRSAVFADFNDDGYADLVFLREDGPPLLYLNRGEDHFSDATSAAGMGFRALNAVDADVADLNHDGIFDLVLWAPNGYSVLFGQGSGQFEAADSPPALSLVQTPFAKIGTVADLQGSGFDDLVAFDASGQLHAAMNQGGKFRESRAVSTSAHSSGTVAVLAASLTNPGTLDLVTADSHGEVRILQRQGPPARWAAVTLDGYKSNKQGVGSVVEFKSGDFYKKVLATGAPVRIFTGKIDKLDVVRVTWPDLIVENEIDAATNKAVDIRESERLASSCPFLYVWNGHRYVFLSDIMGVAPIGELAPDGSYLRPNPDQVVRLGQTPQSHNGRLTLQITSEMRETDYFDQLRLVAVDHPSSERIYGNEIYSSAPLPPEIYAVRDERPPVSAVDDRGDDALPLIRNTDRRYPTDFRRNRILGLAETHTLTLDLGRFPSSDDPALWLTGWVFWTDSNASRALLNNNSLSMISPYLQVRDKTGDWVTAIADMGLPSGTGRTFRVDLAGKFLSADHHVRIVTNLCVYWDRIVLSLNDRRLDSVFDDRAAGAGANHPAAPESDGEFRGRAAELPLTAADLHYRGFSIPITDVHHLKPDDFDYSRRLADAPWNPFRGHYTRFGRVDELLSQADDRLAVMATGDELTVSFNPGGLRALPHGWQRDYFLYARGYAKDGEPNTADFRTSEPLPFFQMSSYPYAPANYPSGPAMRQYLDIYETRPGYDLVPRLAPAAASRR